MIKYIRKSFKRELMFGFVIVAVLPLIFTSGFLIESFKVKLERDHEKQNMEQAIAIEGILETKFQSYLMATEQMMNDEQMIELLRLSDPSVQNEIYSLLYAATDGLRTDAQFDIYTGGGVCICSTGMGMVHENLPTYWGILRMASAHPEKMIIQQEYNYTGSSDILLRAARAIQDSESNNIGYVVISMRKENFEQILNGMHTGQDGICILNEFWEEIYSTDVAEKQKIATVLRNDLLEGEKVHTEYNNNNIYITKIGDTGLYIAYLRPKAFDEDTIKTMYRVMLVMTLLSLMLCLVVAAKLSKKLTNPLNELNDAMQRVQEGKLDTQICNVREDEFGKLADSFNMMTRELKSHIERQMRHQKELNEANIAMMHAQLNPHFLYNTLDTMKWVAKANGIQELAVMATKLAKILRMSISKQQFVTLREEMELVESYICIQEIRFAGAFTFEDVVPEELKDCIVPKLVVQPIVENAILHGFEGRQDGHLCVTVSEQDGDLFIRVCDNGCGISDEIMEALNSRKQEKAAGHIGFYNVDTIIQLNYGKKYGLHVERPEQGGTCVTIVLPKKKEE